MRRCIDNSERHEKIPVALTWRFGFAWTPLPDFEAVKEEDTPGERPDCKPHSKSESGRSEMPVKIPGVAGVKVPSR